MEEKLFDAFPPVSTQEWEAAIAKDLKGADYDKKLVWKTLEGFSVRPYYRADDLSHTDYSNLDPGTYPYLRGTKPDNNWLIHQSFDAQKGLAEANTPARAALEAGVQSIGFGMDAGKVYTKEDIAQLLQGIALDKVSLQFDHCCRYTPELIEAVLAYAADQKIPHEALRIRFLHSPLSCLFSRGAICADKKYTVIYKSIEQTQDYPNIQVLCLSGYDTRVRGANIVQEVAYTLAMGRELFNLLSDTGLTPEQIAKALFIKMAVGTNYFMEIAKFRAIRWLWTKFIEARGVTDPNAAKIFVQATTSPWEQTIYDRHVNLLRGTTEAMSAAIAGVDSLEVLPFDHPLQPDDAFSRRLAKNIQLILKEEAHFDKVSDPAGGSYYVTILTESIATEAYKIYREVMELGGYAKSFEEGYITKELEATAQRRKQLIASRRDTLLGVNQYPNFTETAPETLTEAVLDATERGATDFEKLRLRTERSGKNPKAFMLTFGNLAMCRARAQFACNFFAVAGIHVEDNNRFATIEEGVKAALASGAQLVVACSSDDEYEQAVPQIVAGIGDKALVTVAGNPACRPALEAQGITHFISVRDNVLETLLQYQKELGI